MYDTGAGFERKLYTIQAVAKAVGISRNLVIYYEKNKVFFPSEIDKETGYRYYTATDINRLMGIVALSNLGLELKDIRKYLGEDDVKSLVERLSEKRRSIDNAIKMLELRENIPQKPFIDHISGFYYKRKEETSTSPHEAVIIIKKDFEEFITEGSLPSITELPKIEIINPSRFTLRDITEKFAIIFPTRNNIGEKMEEFDALTIYHFGPYEKMGAVLKEAVKYARKKRIKLSSSIILEFIESSGVNKYDASKIICRIMMPIKK